MKIKLILVAVLLLLFNQESILLSQDKIFPTYRPITTSTTYTLPYTDTFTRANGALTAPYSNSPSSTIAIASNHLTAGVSSAGPQLAWLSSISTFTTSQYGKVVNTAGDVNSHIGVTLFTTDASNYYYIDCSSGGCTLTYYKAGVSNYVGAFNIAGVTSTDTVCAEIDSGATIKLKVNAAYDAQTYAVSALTGPGAVGVYFGDQGTTPRAINQFTAGNGVCP